MSSENNFPVLEIRREGDLVSYLLKYGNISVPGELVFSLEQVRTLSAQVGITMQVAGPIGHRGVDIALVDRPDVGDNLAFTKMTADILPYAIQDELKRLVGKVDHLQIRTDQLTIPWEMLELSAFHCPECGAEVRPAICPRCHRVQFPGRHPDTACACGCPRETIFAAWEPVGCQHKFDYASLQVEPTVHIGLGFGIERRPLSDPAQGAAQPLDIAAEKHPISILFIENPGGLYYSDQELNDLRNFLVKNPHVVRAHILNRGNASKHAIRRALETDGPFDIVHFAGHGVFLPEEPMNSYLSLTDGEKLGIQDVRDLFDDYPPQLAILNGCQTGLVIEQAGSKTGFPACFLEIGTRSVIGTLSAVADRQACYLILYLYHELLQGESLQQALLHAKRRIVRKEFQPARGEEWWHPRQVSFMYSWSSYTIYGDGTLRLRRFPVNLTWHELVLSARNNLHVTSDDPAQDLVERPSLFWGDLYSARLELPDAFLSDSSHNILIGLDVPGQPLLETAYYQAGLDRHVVGLIDLATSPALTELDRLIGTQLLGRQESFSELLPFLEQMTTDESTCLFVVKGLDQSPNPSEVIQQLISLGEAGQGAVHFVVDGDRHVWARLWATHRRALRRLVYNQADLVRAISGVLLSKLYSWADEFSARGLGSITTDKWNPNHPELYIQRKVIEDQIDEFLLREPPATRGFCVLGETGRGKTNLLCRLYRRFTALVAADHDRITLFSTAHGLMERAGSPSNMKHFLEDELVRCLLGSVGEPVPGMQEALRVLRGESGGRPVELVFLIDAVNEVQEEHAASFVEGLKALVDGFRTHDGQGLYLSLIASSRTFFWRSLWGGQEIEHRNYFPNLSLEGGDIEENLLDFDLTTEARSAYTCADLKPAWEVLSDNFRELFRTPFFLQIVRAIARTDIGGEIPGDYYGVMKHYEDIVLLRNQRTRASLQLSETREAVIRTMVAQIVEGEPGEHGQVYLQQEVRIRDLRSKMEGFSTQEIERTILDFCNENVLENRGAQLRFAFDRFFDYLFRNHLIEHFNRVKEREAEWLRVITMYYRTEYHRPGVCAALAHELGRLSQPDQAVRLLSLLLHQGIESIRVPSYRQLILDAMTAFGEENPERLAKMLLLLYVQDRDSETVAEVACSVISSPRVHRNSRQALIGVVERVLRDYLTGLRRSSHNQQARRNIINLVGGLGKVDNGVELIVDVVAAMIGIDYETGNLPRPFLLVMEIFFDPAFQNALSSIRKKAVGNFRDSDGRVRMLGKTLLAALQNPIAILPLLFQRRYFTLALYVGETLQRIELGLEILIKGVFLWFTEQRSSAEDKFHLSIQTVDVFLERSLLTAVIRRFNDPAATDAYKQEMVENTSFYIGLVGIWPEIKRLFSYSEQGLDYLSMVLDEPGRGAELAELLRLLDVSMPMSDIPDAPQRLVELYLKPDAFQNYLGMLATIVQGTREFGQIEAMLWELFTADYSGKIIAYRGQQIPEGVKVAREVFSILSYMIKRSSQVNRGQLRPLILFTHKLIEKFFEFNPATDELTDNLRYFQKLELFDHEDPFNPLLPLGVAAQYLSERRLALGDQQNYALVLIDRFYQSRLKQRLVLINRVLRELVPMSYFAPLVVVGTLDDIIRNRRALIQGEPKIRAALLDVLKSLDLTIGEHVEKMFDYLRLHAQNMMKDDYQIATEFLGYVNQLEADALGRKMESEQIEYLYRSIDVFGGHDLVTTIFIEYGNVRQILVPFISGNIERVKTASELVFGVAAALVGLFASPRINFSLTRLVYESLGVQIGDNSQ